MPRPGMEEDEPALATIITRKGSGGFSAAEGSAMALPFPRLTG